MLRGTGILVNAEGTLTTRRRCSGLSNQSVDVRDELDIRAIFHFDVIAQVILAFLCGPVLNYYSTVTRDTPKHLGCGGRSLAR